MDAEKVQQVVEDHLAMSKSVMTEISIVLTAAGMESEILAGQIPQLLIKANNGHTYLAQLVIYRPNSHEPKNVSRILDSTDTG